MRDLISGEALARTGYFDAAAVERDCGLLRNGKAAKLGTFTKLGLGGVVATQLWHHLYLGGALCDLPRLAHRPEAERAPQPATIYAVA